MAVEETVQEETIQDEETSVEETSIEEETSTEETSEESEESEEEFTAEDLRAMRELYKGLQNPATSGTIVKRLATNLGVDLGTTSSEKTVVDKETGKTTSIKQLVESRLPDEWKSMGPILADVLEGFQAEVIKPALTETESQQEALKGENAIAAMVEKYDDFQDHADAINKLAKELPFGDRKASQKAYNTYLERLYLLAKGSGGANSQDVNSKIAASLGRTVKNARRAKPSPSGDGTRVKSVAKPKSTREAIAQAMADLKKNK